MSDPKPRVIADGPLDPTILEGLGGHVELLGWETTEGPRDETIAGIYTYGHRGCGADHLPLGDFIHGIDVVRCDGPIMDRFPNLKVISNYGVGVDLFAATARSWTGFPT